MPVLMWLMSTGEKSLSIVCNLVRGRPAYFVENKSNPVIINVSLTTCALVVQVSHFSHSFFFC